MTSQSFFNRERELRLLDGAWRAATDGDTTLVLISADSGLGKTRLVQRFYDELSGREDPEGYWPSRLPDYDVEMSIEPEFSELSAGDQLSMPWFWCAIGCAPPATRNLRHRNRSALELARRQVRLHLAGFYAAKQRRARTRDVGKSSLAILANFAFPGAGGVLAVGGEILEVLDTGATVHDAIRSVWARWQARGQGVDAGQIVAAEEHESLVESTLSALEIICGEKHGDPLPAVFVVDDAHWADPSTLEVVERIIHEGRAHGWRLLVLMTAWEDVLKQQRYEGQTEAHLARVVAELEENFDEAIIRLPLEPLPTAEVRDLVATRLPIFSLR